MLYWLFSGFTIAVAALTVPTSLPAVPAVQSQLIISIFVLLFSIIILLLIAILISVVSRQKKVLQKNARLLQDSQPSPG